MICNEKYCIDLIQLIHYKQNGICTDWLLELEDYDNLPVLVYTSKHIDDPAYSTSHYTLYG